MSVPSIDSKPNTILFCIIIDCPISNFPKYLKIFNPLFKLEFADFDGLWMVKESLLVNNSGQYLYHSTKLNPFLEK